jgi:predicted nicotinamide N-methyase
VKDERLPYWAEIWPSSVALAAYVGALEGGGRRMLELGCGTGLVASAALIAGFDVTATDYYEDALLFARLNGLRNAGAEPSVAMLDWRQLPDTLGTFDVIVASDVLYEKVYPALVAEVIARALAVNGVALVADPGRLAAPEFPGECEQRGLVVSERTRVPFSEAGVNQTIDVLTIRRS